MKILVSAALLTALSFSAQASTNLASIDEAGVRKLVADNNGRIVLVGFWATWCEPCRAELPALSSLTRKFAAQDFKMFLVSADEPEQEKDAADLLAKAGISIPSFIKRTQDDQRFIDSIDPQWNGALPALFLYDRSGKRIKTWIGETEIREILMAVNAALAHKKPRQM